MSVHSPASEFRRIAVMAFESLLPADARMDFKMAVEALVMEFEHDRERERRAHADYMRLLREIVNMEDAE